MSGSSHAPEDAPKQQLDGILSAIRNVVYRVLEALSAYHERVIVPLDSTCCPHKAM